MAGVTYDTEALIAAERNNRRMWALRAGLLAEEVAPIVPAPVLAEAWRGGPRQANVASCHSNREHIDKVGQAIGVTLRIDDV